MPDLRGDAPVRRRDFEKGLVDHQEAAALPFLLGEREQRVPGSDPAIRIVRVDDDGEIGTCEGSEVGHVLDPVADQRRDARMLRIGRAEDRGAAEAHARLLAQAAYRLPGARNWRVAPLGGLSQENEIILLGPAEAPIAVLRKRYRFRLAAKAPRSADL